MDDRVRRRRLALGWSQAELAAAAGVSRQLVAAVEAGRNLPSVSAALGLAAALGVSVEELFGEQSAGAVLAAVPGTAEPAVGDPLLVARVGETRVWAPVTEPGEGGFRLADAAWSEQGPRLLDGADLSGFVVAGCEPALGTAAAAAPGRGPGRLVIAHAATGRSIQALAAGRVHAAVVHAPAAELPAPPEQVMRWELARWHVGLAYQDDEPSLPEIAAGKIRVAQREAAAGSQQALLRALAALEAPTGVVGPVADGHVAAARMVDASAVAAGLTTAAAASALRLGFTALEEHVVQVWVDRRFLEHPGLSTLLQVWCSARLQAQLRRLGGYNLSGAGTQVDP